MSNQWHNDIFDMHSKYGLHGWIETHRGNPELMKKFLEFRINFLEEELNETRDAVRASDPEEIVDGLIDLCVIAIGTLDAFNIDAQKAWEQVQTANMAKEVGVKESRPNPLGLPDLVKPKNWKAPSHADNHGYLTNNV
jgi:hypothetical protein|tara:strand:- start:913 stop:1326 length:414 start_codon:yes stop_codon:yes gene_type:complete